jgi:hypothetical protein
LNSTRIRFISASVAVLLIAAGMSLAGLYAWDASKSFSVLLTITASCLTWILLSPAIIRRSIFQTVLIGIASPFLGVIFVVALEILVGVPEASPGLIPMGWIWILLSAWISLPIGAITALLIRAALLRILPDHALPK